MNQTLYVLQGGSGAGKSTVAQQIQFATPNTVICSTDDFHVEDGVYRFKADRLGEFHKANLEKAKVALDAGKSVIVDNTNIKCWESREYVKHAVKLGIPVVFIRVAGNFQNTHGVPDGKVQTMLRNMENLTLESVLNSVTPWETNNAPPDTLPTKPM